MMERPLFSAVRSRARTETSDGRAEWSRDAEGLHIRTDFASDMPIVFKLTID